MSEPPIVIKGDVSNSSPLISIRKRSNKKVELLTPEPSKQPERRESWRLLKLESLEIPDKTEFKDDEKEIRLIQTPML